jgi:hydroxyethylthiazole kinase
MGRQTRPDRHLRERASDLLATLRQRRPVVHHLANLVTAAEVAAATRAVGAMPIMAISPAEVEEVTASADALVISLGTPTAERLQAVDQAVRVARRRGVPTVIDPVGAGASRLRTETARRILAAASWPVIRANPAEAEALVGSDSRTGRRGALRGVDAARAYTVEQMRTLGAALVRSGGIAALTGPADVVTDGRRVLVVHNGHPWLAAMPGAGCMATAVVGAFVAVAERADFLTAAAVGLSCFGAAAEQAARQAGGPGTLKPLVVDALARLTPAALAGRMRVHLLAPAAVVSRGRGSR